MFIYISVCVWRMSVSSPLLLPPNGNQRERMCPTLTKLMDVVVPSMSHTTALMAAAAAAASTGAASAVGGVCCVVGSTAVAGETIFAECG